MDRANQYRSHSREESQLRSSHGLARLAAVLEGPTAHAITPHQPWFPNPPQKSPVIMAMLWTP